MKLLSILLAGAMVYGAEPDWQQIEKHSLEFLQQYVRIRSINPPADTAEAARFFQSELEKNGLTPKVSTTFGALGVPKLSTLVRWLALS